MIKKELVIDAINFNNPARIPIWFFNRDQHYGDIGIYFQDDWGTQDDLILSIYGGKYSNPVIKHNLNIRISWDCMY